MRALLITLIIISLSSCTVTKFITPKKDLSKQEVQADIEFIKTKLIENHFDINWEKQKDNIIHRLDSVSNNSVSYNVSTFEEALAPILNHIDDGHSRIVGFEKKEYAQLIKKEKKASKFTCTKLKDNTVYLKVPNFTDNWKLNGVLGKFEDFVKFTPTDRIIIDLRNNHGGKVPCVKFFLNYTLQKETDFCISTKIKRNKGFGNFLYEFVMFLRYGFKKSEDYLVKNCGSLKPALNFGDSKKYLLIDSTIISGASIATYHLQKDGYEVIGSAPSSLCNTFGNAVAFNLPNSKLYIVLSTARVHVNENYLDRDNDQIVPDLELSNYNLDKIMTLVVEKEKTETK